VSRTWGETSVEQVWKDGKQWDEKSCRAAQKCSVSGGMDERNGLSGAKEDRTAEAVSLTWGETSVQPV
jgi:hypothetical protein